MIRGLLRRLERPGPVILAYHRVADLAFDPQLLAVGRARFREQLEMLAERFEVLGLAELAQRVQAGQGRAGMVAITFDDGYADNQQAAADLERAGLPATFFVTTSAVASDREFWWDELESICLAQAEDQAGRDGPWNVLQRPDTPGQRQYLGLHKRLRPMAPDQIEAELRRLCPQRSPARRTHRTMDVAGLQELARRRDITVGSHTHRHPSMARMPFDVQVHEMRASRDWLQRTIGTAVDAASYPFGSARDVDASTVEACRTTGYRWACINVPGRLRANTHPLKLPRIIMRDWQAEEANRFVRVSTGLKP